MTDQLALFVKAMVQPDSWFGLACLWLLAVTLALTIAPSDQPAALDVCLLLCLPQVVLYGYLGSTWCDLKWRRHRWHSSGKPVCVLIVFVAWNGLVLLSSHQRWLTCWNWPLALVWIRWSCQKHKRPSVVWMLGVPAYVSMAGGVACWLCGSCVPSAVVQVCCWTWSWIWITLPGWIGFGVERMVALVLYFWDAWPMWMSWCLLHTVALALYVYDTLLAVSWASFVARAVAVLQFVVSQFALTVVAAVAYPVFLAFALCHRGAIRVSQLVYHFVGLDPAISFVSQAAVRVLKSALAFVMLLAGCSWINHWGTRDASLALFWYVLTTVSATLASCSALFLTMLDLRPAVASDCLHEPDATRWLCRVCWKNASTRRRQLLGLLAALMAPFVLRQGLLAALVHPDVLPNPAPAMCDSLCGGFVDAWPSHVLPSLLITSLPVVFNGWKRYTSNQQPLDWWHTLSLCSAALLWLSAIDVLWLNDSRRWRLVADVIVQNVWFLYWLTCV